jgi:hypothetical protein
MMVYRLFLTVLLALGLAAAGHAALNFPSYASGHCGSLQQQAAGATHATAGVPATQTLEHKASAPLHHGHTPVEKAVMGLDNGHCATACGACALLSGSPTVPQPELQNSFTIDQAIPHRDVLPSPPQRPPIRLQA